MYIHVHINTQFAVIYYTCFYKVCILKLDHNLTFTTVLNTVRWQLWHYRTCWFHRYLIFQHSVKYQEFEWNSKGINKTGLDKLNLAHCCNHANSQDIRYWYWELYYRCCRLITLLSNRHYTLCQPFFQCFWLFLENIG